MFDIFSFSLNIFTFSIVSFFLLPEDKFLGLFHFNSFKVNFYFSYTSLRFFSPLCSKVRIKNKNNGRKFFSSRPKSVHFCRKNSDKNCKEEKRPMILQNIIRILTTFSFEYSNDYGHFHNSQM